jgi:hypothetical protein
MIGGSEQTFFGLDYHCHGPVSDVSMGRAGPGQTVRARLRGWLRPAWPVCQGQAGLSTATMVQHHVFVPLVL